MEFPRRRNLDGTPWIGTPKQGCLQCPRSREKASEASATECRQKRKGTVSFMWQLGQVQSLAIPTDANLCAAVKAFYE